MMKKKKIFLTGATGHMGSEGLKQLLQRRDEFDICLLVLPTEKDRKAIAPYEKLSGVEVIYGDLTRYEDVLQGVNNADYVLHVGGMVSPIADYYPQKTLQVNVGAVKNIIRAIKAQSNPDRVHLVYIGTVAQTGDRNDPIHWDALAILSKLASTTSMRCLKPWQKERSSSRDSSIGCR